MGMMPFGREPKYKITRAEMDAIAVAEAARRLKLVMQVVTDAGRAGLVETEAGCAGLLAVAHALYREALTEVEFKNVIDEDVPRLPGTYQCEEVARASSGSFAWSPDEVTPGPLRPARRRGGLSAVPQAPRAPDPQAPALTLPETAELDMFRPWEEFARSVRDREIMDYDGYARLATASHVSDIEVLPSSVAAGYTRPPWATHVVWCKR